MKKIDLFNGDYLVDEDGKVYSSVYRNKKGQIHELTQVVTKNGRMQVSIRRKNYLVHRLIAYVFIPNPNKFPEVNHIDGDPKNNHVSNLEWCTRSMNMSHAFINGLKKNRLGESHQSAKLSNGEVIAIRNHPDSKKRGFLSETARKYSITPTAVQAILKGRSWRHL